MTICKEFCIEKQEGTYYVYIELSRELDSYGADADGNQGIEGGFYSLENVTSYAPNGELIAIEDVMSDTELDSLLDKALSYAEDGEGDYEEDC